ncbi:FadR/GntR family transcriptional regulator [Actinomadura madurae]|uniref:FadR/GntR family transcriptional regulator n=1 Tax=Actinomadura madurae TaxID=1993 RepID=UPI0020D20819|nr:FCD domain-containing protein [Actinomadura madurae]MCQ0019607.1 FCD domain-containing protein [Actinomadura madurae]
MSQDVARPSLADALTERMLELIRSDGLRPGDRLPSARELSQRFAVTTPTLREALRRAGGDRGDPAPARLRDLRGRRPRTGGDPQPQRRGAGGRPAAPAAGRPAAHRAAAGGRAARLSGPADVDLLRAILDRAGADLGDAQGADARDAEARLHKTNMTFHREVAGVAGNSVLCEVIDSLLTVHASEQREIQRIFDDRVRDFEEHTAILAAIEAGAEEEAESLMRSHLADIKHVIEQRLT